ncbi:MAG: flagellar protein FlaG [Candidatus Hydrogenedens sp.]
MGMSRIDFQNTAALPMVIHGETPLPAPPRIPSSQGSGAENPVVVSDRTAPGEAEQRAELQKETVGQITTERNEILKKLELPMTTTRLKVDEENQRIVIQILDSQNQVIRQIPPEEWLKFLSRWQKVQGLFFDEQV